jgi:hypothetical protein
MDDTSGARGIGSKPMRDRAIQAEELTEDDVQHRAIGIVHIDMDWQIEVALRRKALSNRQRTDGEALGDNVLFTNLP